MTYKTKILKKSTTMCQHNSKHEARYTEKDRKRHTLTTSYNYKIPKALIPIKHKKT